MERTEQLPAALGICEECSRTEPTRIYHSEDCPSNDGKPIALHRYCPHNDCEAVMLTEDHAFLSAGYWRMACPARGGRSDNWIHAILDEIHDGSPELRYRDDSPCATEALERAGL